MITKIYSPIQIPILEERIPVDVHSIICKYLGFSRHYFIYRNLLYNDNITELIKKYIYYECFPKYKHYDKHMRIDYEYEKMVVENMHNVVEIHKMLPLLYKRTTIESSYCNSDEWKTIYKIITFGYEINTRIDDYAEECRVYRLLDKPIIEDITLSQVILAFLSHKLNFYSIFEGDKMDVRFRVSPKIPKKHKLDNYISKIKSSCVMFTKINEPSMEPELLEDNNENENI